MFVRRDIHFNERVIGLAQLILTVDNFFRGKSADKTLIFPFLPSETDDSTKFTYVNTNPTLTLVSNTYATPLLLQLTDNSSSTNSRLTIFLNSTNIAETWENKINAIPNDKAYNQPPNGTPTLCNHIPTISNPILTAHNKLSNTATILSNATNNIPDTIDDSDNNLSDAPLFSTLKDSEITDPQRFTCSRANQVDYKKFFQKEKADAVKTNPLVPLSSLYSKANRIFFDYVLNHSKKQSTRGFIHIV